MSASEVPKRLITLNQAARRLGVRPGTLYKWKCAGKNLTFYKIGAGVKCDPDEVAQFIEKGRQRPLSFDR